MPHDVTFDYSSSGLLRCSRYSFGPNRLHYCGPDANQELLAHIQHKTSDPRLEQMLKAFNTLYPYLCLIAKANHIKDPFDDKVVCAYWLGNNLLENVSRQDLYRNLTEDHKVQEKIGSRSLEEIKEKIRNYALPHHSFHVLNIWRRTGNMAIAHTLESMDSCRIGWGKVANVDGPFLSVQTQPIVERAGILFLGDAIEKRLTRTLGAYEDIEQIKINDIVTYHWGVPCEVISSTQAELLKKYTMQSIAFANKKI